MTTSHTAQPGQHVQSLADLRIASRSCLAIGSFDGVHRGHQLLIGAMAQQAHGQGYQAVVVTFFPHPSVVLRGRRPSFYLTTPDDKVSLLAQLGVDAVVTHPFNREVAEVSASEFVANLVRTARLAELWCGPDFALGHKRQGDVAFLRDAGAAYDFTVRVLEPVLIDGEIISSTRIRQTLRDGAVEQAARYLGRPFRLAGQVVKGAERGRKLGIPTANLALWEEYAVPAVGVYACRATYPDPAGKPQQAQAVVNIGFRPTFEGGDPHPVVEAHLLDVAPGLYGATLALDFVARLRAEQKFPGVEALVAQIHRDIAEARQLLA